jgi:hypothetical protein
MEEFELEIFEQTSDYSERRFSRGGGAIETRGLDRSTIDELIEDVDRNYAEDSMAHLVFGSAPLRALGTDPQP